MIPRCNIYFSGAGLMDLGVSRAGCHVVQSFEIDTACVATARANFQHQIIQTDISGKLASADSDCHAMGFSYPCNKYSNASAIHGHQNGDALFLHALRHIAVKRPEIYWAENVPGMRKFPVVMEAMTKLAGYYTQVFCPIKSEWWLPQKRDRLILIGSRKPFTWRQPEPSRPSRLKHILEKNPEVRIPRYVAKRIKGRYRDLPIISDPQQNDIAPTCVAHYAKDLSTRLLRDRRFPHGLRPYTVREYARLQGVPDTFQFIGTENDAYRMIGNGVSVPVGEWIGHEIKRYFNR